jgi:hypothetical protein
MTKTQRARLAIAATVLLLATEKASATGGFGCEISDTQLRLAASAALGRGMGSPLVNFASETEILLKEAPQQLKKIDLTPALVHHWIEGGELRLHFYAETTGDEPFSSVEIIVKTSGNSAELEEFQGTYTLNLFSMEPPLDKEGGKSLVYEGKASCMVE